VKATTAGATHVVQKGETLWKIARHYQVNPNELARVNGISDPTLLKIGTSLNIPGGTANGPTSPGPAGTPGGKCRYGNAGGIIELQSFIADAQE
jgi:murein DD-endopeptidase MepM/ murein hydrolase activator NlpD